MYNNSDADPWINTEERAKTPLYKHIAKTYAWMFLGLMVTFATAYSLYSTGLVWFVFYFSWMPIALLIAKLALVWFLTSKMYSFQVNTVRTIFLAYSFLTGVVFSTLFIMYDATDSILLFGVTALFFGLMAGIGLITKKDVSRYGSIIVFGLVALLIMSLISYFLNLYMLDIILCFVGLFVFLGVTTYDSKKAKDFYYQFEGDSEMLEKISVYSALNLYLDFINVFLYLLRLFGKKR